MTNYSLPDHQVIGNKLNFFAWLNNLKNLGIGILTNAGAPTSGTSGTFVNKAGPGCLLLDTTNTNLYMNTNTLASPTWTLFMRGATFSGDVSVSAAGATTLSNSLLQRATGTIASADITGTGAGQLGHANGVVLLAAPGANLAWQLVSFGLYYTFATAAYTGGGNLTVNWGAGGAALTGLVSAANSLTAASSKAVQFFPLSTVGVAIVSNASLNLVSSAAPTQPGTAAGTIAWELWYRKLAVGF